MLNHHQDLRVLILLEYPGHENHHEVKLMEGYQQMNETTELNLRRDLLDVELVARPIRERGRVFTDFTETETRGGLCGVRYKHRFLNDSR